MSVVSIERRVAAISGPRARMKSERSRRDGDIHGDVHGDGDGDGGSVEDEVGGAGGGDADADAGGGSDVTDTVPCAAVDVSPPAPRSSVCSPSVSTGNDTWSIPTRTFATR